MEIISEGNHSNFPDLPEFTAQAMWRVLRTALNIGPNSWILVDDTPPRLVE
jgi:hypothetical protein